MNEVLQWLIDHKAQMSVVDWGKGEFVFRIAVKDPHGGEDHYVVFDFEDSDFIRNFIEPSVAALKESING